MTDKPNAAPAPDAATVELPPLPDIEQEVYARTRTFLRNDEIVAVGQLMEVYASEAIRAAHPAPVAAPAPDAKEENLATMARIGALRCEGGPHSPTGFLLRQLADEFDRLTAAPAPEPVAWALIDDNGKWLKVAMSASSDEEMLTLGWTPLYLHPPTDARDAAEEKMERLKSDLLSAYAIIEQIVEAEVEPAKERAERLAEQVKSLGGTPCA